VARAQRGLAAAAPELPQAVVALAFGELTLAAGEGSPARPLSALHGAAVLAIAGIANPEPFFRRVDALGASDVTRVSFPDHHRFRSDDAERLADLAKGVGLVVCTLKDAVKLAPIWPRAAAPLWYVSQRLEVESGGEVLDRALGRLVSANDVHPEASAARGRRFGI
jgi:tetraacyldisaccharide 4'-kinase